MNLDELKAYLLTVDPNLVRDFFDGDADEYTVWSAHHPKTFMSDDAGEDVTLTVTINRWTKKDRDEIAERIYADLTAANVATAEYFEEFEPESGTLRSIIECYVTKGN